MRTATADGRKLAEDAFAYTPLWPSFEREEHDGYVVFHGPSPHHLFGLALRLRPGADVEPLVEEVRAWFAERGRREFTWLVGDSSTPDDLGERLLGLEAQPDTDEPVYAGMVLTAAPPAVAGLEVRPVETFEEFVAVRELGWDLLGMREDERGEPRARLQTSWAEYQDVDIVNFAAFVDGRVVAAGGVQFTPYGAYLAGGSTLPSTEAAAATAGSCARAGMPRRRAERRTSCPSGKDVNADPRAPRSPTDRDRARPYGPHLTSLRRRRCSRGEAETTQWATDGTHGPPMITHVRDPAPPSSSGSASRRALRMSTTSSYSSAPDTSACGPKTGWRGPLAAA